MTVTLQYFDGCPNWQVAEERLREALRNVGDAHEVVHQLVADPDDAERVGLRGSPTILIDGHDPFTDDAEPVGFACRIYRTEAGTEHAPSVAQLERALCDVC